MKKERSREMIFVVAGEPVEVTMTTTKWICIAIAVAVITIDIWLDRKKTCPTISQFLRGLMEKHDYGWLVPFIMGIIVGHICW